ncbi:hypothetical protein GTQ99_22245, partial [Kineococcus sp. T13]|nr:hypothetical protein [Kineococcus vitellinus]
MSREEADELSPEQQRVRDLLRAHADVGPLPADVAARLDAALAAALAETRTGTRTGAPAGTRAGASVASLAARRRRVRGVQRLLAGVAAAVVVGGGAALAVHQGSAPSTTSAGSGAADSAAASSAAAAEEEVPPQAQVLLSGRDYADAAAVEDLGEEALADEGTGRPAPDATPGAGSTEPGDRTLLNA